MVYLVLWYNLCQIIDVKYERLTEKNWQKVASIIRDTWMQMKLLPDQLATAMQSSSKHEVGQIAAYEDFHHLQFVVLWHVTFSSWWTRSFPHTRLYMSLCQQFLITSSTVTQNEPFLQSLAIVEQYAYSQPLNSWFRPRVALMSCSCRSCDYGVSGIDSSACLSDGSS